jgi:hypothetical protein
VITRDEIVVLLRCAADLQQRRLWDWAGSACLMDATRLLDSGSDVLFHATGAYDRVLSERASEPHPRDTMFSALLEAALLVEEGTLP